MATYDHEKLGAVTAMISAAERPWASMRALRTCVAAIFLSAALLSGAAAATHRSRRHRRRAERRRRAPEIAEFMALLADPKVQKWLLEQQHAAKASKKPAPKEETVSEYIDSRVGATREHYRRPGAPRSPICPTSSSEAVGLLRADIPTRGTVPVLVLAFAALGFGVEWLFRKATQKTRQHLAGLPMETVHDRLRLVAARLAFSLRRGRGLRSRQPRPLLGVRLAAAPSPDAARLSRRLARHPDRGGRRPFSARPRCRALPHRSDGYCGRSVLVPTAHRVCRLVCLRLGDAQPAQRSRLFVGGAPARRLCAWPRSPRHCAGIRVAPAGRAGPGHRSAVTQEASSRPGRTERAAVGRHRAVVGALGGESHAGLLARSGHRHPAARQRRDQAHGRAPPSAARFAAGW